MPEPVRIIGHLNKDGSTNEGLRAQVETDGSLRTELLARYRATDFDESGDPAYYGFTDIDGGWFIEQINTAAGTIRFVKGTTSYTVAWTNRATQTYDYFY